MAIGSAPDAVDGILIGPTRRPTFTIFALDVFHEGADRLVGRTSRPSGQAGGDFRGKPPPIGSCLGSVRGRLLDTIERS